MMRLIREGRNSMQNRLFQASSLGASVLYALMVMIFFYVWQGYAPLPGNDTLVAWATVGVISMVYLAIEYVDTKVAMSPLDAELERFMSYLPLMAFVSVFTAAFWYVITPTTFQWQVGLVFLAVVLVDVFGYSKVLFSKMTATFAVKPKAATK